MLTLMTMAMKLTRESEGQTERSLRCTRLRPSKAVTANAFRLITMSFRPFGEMKLLSFYASFLSRATRRVVYRPEARYFPKFRHDRYEYDG
jgi:hypothetical protein